MMTDAELLVVIDKALDGYKGQVGLIEQAVGVLVLGRRLGWRVTYLVHGNRTIGRYQDILGVKFRDALPEVGDFAQKSLAWRIVSGVGKFWDVIKGRVVLPELKDKVQLLG